MSPEAVTGFSGMPKEGTEEDGATHCADLWAFGALIYILETGSVPFWSPSPYLTFLRIKRGLLNASPWGVADSATRDLIEKLMQVEPMKRLGSESYKVENGKVVLKEGYDVIRNHEYFSAVDKNDKSHVIPSLQDLCIRTCSELAKNDAINLDICDKHPPGDGSKHDLIRLPPYHRNKVLHVLDKSKVFSHGDPERVFQRFFENDIAFLKGKVRPTSRDFVGLTQMNDDEYKPQSARGSADPYAKKDDPEPTNVVFLSSPLLLPSSDLSPDEEKQYVKGWKSTISQINKRRPKAVVVCGRLDSTPKVWKFIGRIRDSIPVVWQDGSCFYTFWLNGFQGLVLKSSDFEKDSLQMKWLQEQMEQSSMAKHRAFCFVDCDPKDLPALVRKRLARGRVTALIGLSKSAENYEDEVEYRANERLEDDSSVKSTDSEEDEDENFTMKVFGNILNGFFSITVEETEEKWSTTFENTQ